MLNWFKYSLILLLLFINVHLASADVASLDSNYVAGQADIVTKLNNDRTTLTNSINNVRGVFAGGIQTSGQVKADTVGEENMADDANPRIRTAEGASCTDLVASGFLSTTSASLVGSIPLGVVYPDGFRVEKTSATARTYTASKWTFVYMLTSGSFSFQEVAIGAATPSDPANSATLFRASTDATTVASILDLRKTSCATGPFSAISDVTGEGTLSDIFSRGRPTVISSDIGWVQGLQVSWDGVTTFKVRSGSTYINGKYRSSTSDTTVPQTADAPSTGGSGLDTGAIAASTTYNVWAVADQENVSTYSVSIGTGINPNGITNFRRIGQILTDGTSLFISRDLVTTTNISPNELVGGMVVFNGTGTVAIYYARNVSTITDVAAGRYRVNWINPFISGDTYSVAGLCGGEPTNVQANIQGDNQTTQPLSTSYGIRVVNSAGAEVDDGLYVNLVAHGDKPK